MWKRAQGRQEIWLRSLQGINADMTWNRFAVLTPFCERSTLIFTCFSRRFRSTRRVSFVDCFSRPAVRKNYNRHRATCHIANVSSIRGGPVTSRRVSFKSSIKPMAIVAMTPYSTLSRRSLWALCAIFALAKLALRLGLRPKRQGLLLEPPTSRTICFELNSSHLANASAGAP